MVDVVDQALGSEGKVNVKVEGGSVVLSLAHVHASGEVQLVVKEDLKYFLDQLKVAISGNVDDVIIDIIKGMIP